MTPGSAVRLISVARHLTDWATRPGIIIYTYMLVQWTYFCYFYGPREIKHFNINGSSNYFTRLVKFNILTIFPLDDYERLLLRYLHL